jgi:cytochrome b561
MQVVVQAGFGLWVVYATPADDAVSALVLLHLGGVAYHTVIRRDGLRRRMT